jgi:hypothetical protein
MTARGHYAYRSPARVTRYGSEKHTLNLHHPKLQNRIAKRTFQVVVNGRANRFVGNIKSARLIDLHMETSLSVFMHHINLE